jgi:hypothetical protein
LRKVRIVVWVFLFAAVKPALAASGKIPGLAPAKAPPEVAKIFDGRWSGFYLRPLLRKSTEAITEKTERLKQSFYCTLKVENTKVTGTCTENENFIDIGTVKTVRSHIEGTLYGHEMTFDRIYDGPDTVQTVHYLGQLAADFKSMSGHWETGAISEHFEAVKN